MSAAPEQTPRQQLETWRANLSRTLNKALYDADVDQCDLADQCGTSRQKVQRWTDKRNPELPSVAHLALMPREVLLALLAPVMDEHGLRIVEDEPQLRAVDGRR